MKRDARQAALTGKAGEHVVAAQLLMRGIVPHWPTVDVGCDLLTESGCRIQVRCAHLYTDRNRKLVAERTCYFFPLPKQRRLPDSNRTIKLVNRRPFVEVCDYIVFWGIEQNRFWIVPATLCDACTGVELGYEPRQKPNFVGSIADMRDMRSLGYSLYKIGKHFGLHQSSVKQFLESGKDVAEESVANKMRVCENRWDFILNFGQPAASESQAPALDAQILNEEAQ